MQDGTHSRPNYTVPFKFLHNNFNVLNLEKSLKFYEDALGLKEVRRKVAGDGSFILARPNYTVPYGHTARSIPTDAESVRRLNKPK